MKILYGIQGVGGGHVSRSLRMIREMEIRGAKVDILISGGNYLRDIGREVKYRFKGFDFKYGRDGGVSKIRTFIHQDFISFFKSLRLDFSEWDLVISDFEPITAWGGYFSGSRVVGISNQISFESPLIPRPDRDPISEFVIRNFASTREKIGLHFHKYDDFIYQPILASWVLEADPKDEDFYLIYLPYVDPIGILNQISGIGKKFEIFHPKVHSEFRGDNFIFKPISREFNRRLTNCTGVICSSGFGTTSEAIYLGKRLMTIPIKNQWEQVCNDWSLRDLGVVRHTKIRDFVNSSSTERKLKLVDPVSQILDKIGI